MKPPPPRTGKSKPADLSATARSIAREIDRLPRGSTATVKLTKDAKGAIVLVEVTLAERLRLWVPEV